MQKLRHKGATVLYHDSFVPELTLETDLLRSQELTRELLQLVDAVVILTPHPDIDLDLVTEQASLVLDTRAALPQHSPRVHRL
jgi:UDP-N-acetyl-D-mannosaminuronate dehydrogenase